MNTDDYQSPISPLVRQPRSQRLDNRNSVAKNNHEQPFRARACLLVQARPARL